MYPRRQADRLVRMLAEEDTGFQAVLLGKRQHGKTNLLQQAYWQLFQRAEGPFPFFYAFPHVKEEATLARHFLAAFCQQVRAFLMRREDLLREPVGVLEREMEQPGLPLSLTELGQEMLASPTGCSAEYISLLPTRFSHREGRPVCLLLDEAQVLAPQSPFFAALGASDVRWLITGRLPFLRQRAGEMAWSVVYLEPFSLEESLTIAETWCGGAGVPFSKTVWQQWCQLAGVSPWLIRLLVQAAAAEGEFLEDVEQLGRVYVRELTTGTLGNWLNVRWQRAVPDRRERAHLVEILWDLARGTLPPSAVAALAPELWDGLVREEWAEDTPTGPQFGLDSVQRDWLETVVDPAASPERRQSRLLQAFLQRADQACRRWPGEELLASLRQRLLALPQVGFAEDVEWEGDKIHPPRICSVAGEPHPSAELFWCYGFRGGQPTQPQVPCVLLIALCRQAPTTGAVQAWNRQLEQEVRLLPAAEDSRASAAADSGLRQELWVVVPETASRVSLASERRFFWEALARLLGVAAPAADPERSPGSFEQAHLSLTIAPRCEVAAIEMLEQIAERQGLRAETTDALRVALTEACRNAVQHSRNHGGKLLINYWISSSKATLNLFNEGVSFGSQQEEALLESASGTGLKLIRSLMDEVILQGEPDGTRLILTKKFQPEATAR
ncbi:MAG: ATP-binding protein [Acidobacteria bacterium]|nr:ATP-binding protein [Acidobacteriota bacterium]